MITLGVDTSTASLTVSMVDENKILADCGSIGTLKHSSLLIPLIEKALKRAGLNVKDINLFSVGTGPGSFTGLRVGITAMRALAIALDRPIAGVPTMDAIAHNALAYLKKENLLGEDIKICPVLDAKKKQVYACIYGHDGANIIRKTDHLLEPAEELVKRLEGRVLFLGDGVELYKKELLHRKSFKAGFLEGMAWEPKASVIAKMAAARYKRGESDDPYDLAPMYLYAQDCNVRKQ